MPNGVTYSDEKTIVKAMTAIAGNGALDFPATLACVARLQDAGILFREEAPTVIRGPRTKAEEAADAQLQVNTPDVPAKSPDTVSEVVSQ